MLYTKYYLIKISLDNGVTYLNIIYNSYLVGRLPQSKKVLQKVNSKWKTQHIVGLSLLISLWLKYTIKSEKIV